MNIDERIEALAQTVELLARMQIDNEKRYAERFAEIDEPFRQNEQRMAQVLDAINRLANIAEAHDVRLDNQEQPLDDRSRRR